MLAKPAWGAGGFTPLRGTPALGVPAAIDIGFDRSRRNHQRDLLLEDKPPTKNPISQVSTASEASNPEGIRFVKNSNRLMLMAF